MTDQMEVRIPAVERFVMLSGVSAVGATAQTKPKHPYPRITLQGSDSSTASVLRKAQD